MTELSPAQIIAYGEKMGWISRIAHPLGDVLGLDEKAGVLLSYFRNNVTHLYAAAAWVACCFLNNRRMARASILRLGRLVYPFIQSELFLPWTDDEFAERIQQTIDFFVARGLLGTDADGRVITRQPGQSDSAFRLRSLARNLLPAIERYYIGLALLVKNGPHTLSAGELETLCWLTAQRLSLLHELNAPEFFDRSLFRGFIQKLRERRVICGGRERQARVRCRARTRSRKDARVILEPRNPPRHPEADAGKTGRADARQRPGIEARPERDSARAVRTDRRFRRSCASAYARSVVRIGRIERCARESQWMLGFCFVSATIAGCDRSDAARCETAATAPCAIRRKSRRHIVATRQVHRQRRQQGEPDDRSKYTITFQPDGSRRRAHRLQPRPRQLEIDERRISSSWTLGADAHDVSARIDA